MDVLQITRIAVSFCHRVYDPYQMLISLISFLSLKILVSLGTQNIKFELQKLLKQAKN